MSTYLFVKLVVEELDRVSAGSGEKPIVPVAKEYDTLSCRTGFKKHVIEYLQPKPKPESIRAVPLK